MADYNQQEDKCNIELYTGSMTLTAEDLTGLKNT